MAGPPSAGGPAAAGELAVVRASGRRLSAYGVTGASVDGWTLVPAEAVAPLALSARTPGCVLRWAAPADPDPATGPSVTVHGPAGEVVALGGDAGPELAERAAALLDRPGAGAVLHRALTVDWPAYDAVARVADVCRALGVPLSLLTGESTEDTSVPAPAGADVGLVLGRLDPAAAAAQSPLTGQSAWIAPLGGGWSLRVWDGDGPNHPLPATALGLSQGRRDGLALAVWWTGGPAPGPRRAGLFLARAGRAVAAHEWSPRVDLGIGHTAGAGRTLAAAFGVPGRALDITAALRRDASDPVGALTDVLTGLGVPPMPVGAGRADLVDAARSTPGAVHAPRLSPLRAVVHAIGEAPATTVVERAARERPPWYRIANAALAAVMALATVVLYLNWRWGTMAWWWVALGAATTVGYAVAVRPRRRRRR